MTRILIADDIEDNRYLLRMLLEGNGYVVEEATNGSDALLKAIGNPPDIIVTDILMPVIDGFTLCRIWKADERLSRIPLVFYTATYTDPRDEELALDLGADAFIVKPAEPDEFIRRIGIVLAEVGRATAGPRRQRAREETILRGYSEALVRKLEHKMLVLERTNRELEAQMAARDRAEKALSESERRFRSLFENSMSGILLTEPDGNILNANPEACRLLGRSEDELRRMGRQGIVIPGDPAIAAALAERERKGRFRGELFLVRADGSTFPCEVSSALFRDEEGHLKTSMEIRDITERKRSEREMCAMLEEKDILIKEIHHRVKNNMQVISSMVALQLGGVKESVASGDIAMMVHDIQGRIRSMALVHEILYQSGSLSRIDFGKYLGMLVDSLSPERRAVGGRVAITVDVTELFLDITMAVPLGLMVNELVTNALRHAFPAGGAGSVAITAARDDGGRCRLTVRDTGRGFPAGFTMKGATSFGMSLVNILSDQIRATMEVVNDGGAAVTISFTPARPGDGSDESGSTL